MRDVIADETAPWAGARIDGCPADADVSFHILDGEALLFHERRQELYRLDRPSAFIWCCVAEGMGTDETAARLADAASISLDSGRTLVDAASAQWRSLGLVCGGADADPPPAPETTHRSAGPRLRPARRVGKAHSIRLAGLDMRLRFDDPRVLQRVAPVFDHLATRGQRPRAVAFDVRAMSFGWIVACNGHPVARARAIGEIAPMLKALMVQAVLARVDYRLAIHAAALASNGRAVLLPGASGHGKTTLAAALMAAGFSYLGDDTVLLEGEALHVRPIPLAPAVKSGAWPLLSGRYASLATRPIDRRPDGKCVRYLRPRAVVTRPVPVAWVIFPDWRDSGADLAPMPRVEALRWLLSGCYVPGHRLRAGDIASLIAWIGRVDCYRLASGDLDGAVRCVARLCR